MKAWLFALTVLTIAGCRPDCGTGDPARPNVILITIDTLRADHLGAYGATKVQTPHLDRLAAEGLLFERMYSLSHITIPSHLSIMTSLPIGVHGIDDNKIATPRPMATVVEPFRAAGYRTAAFVSANHLGPAFAVGKLLEAQLETFEVPERLSHPRTADDTNAAVARWVRGVCRQPFFVWIHYWDPHVPYTPPPAWGNRYYEGDPFDRRHTSLLPIQHNWFMHDMTGLRRRLMRRYAADVRAVKRALGVSSRDARQAILYPTGPVRRLADPTARAAIRERIRRTSLALRSELPFRKGLVDFLTGVGDLEYPMALYRAEVAYVDDAIGRLRGELERLGIGGRTALVVTADHGEALGEHGLWFTHFGLSEPNVRIPLIVWAPGRVAPARRPELVSSLDVAPTALALAGLPVGPAMQGRNVLAPLPDERPVIGEAIGRNQISIVSGNWKLIRTVDDVYYSDTWERLAGALELFDLAADPREAHDRHLEDTATAARLGADLDRVVRQRAPADQPAPALTPRQAEQLRALGYVE